jgi:hypothetical protein
MKIDFTTPLRNFDGTVIKDGEKDLTVKDIVNRSLMGAMPQQQGKTLTPDEAVNAFEIATKIMGDPKGEKLKLKPADVVLIDKAIKMCTWAPLVYGQVKKILDGEATGLEPKTK